jgi:hypothetical protein
MGVEVNIAATGGVNNKRGDLEGLENMMLRAEHGGIKPLDKNQEPEGEGGEKVMQEEEGEYNGSEGSEDYESTSVQNSGRRIIQGGRKKMVTKY